MRAIRAMRGVIVLLLLIAASIARAEPAAPVSARSGLDRPAIWVADRVTFSIDVTCAPGYDILTDDLSRDKLKLAPGLDLIGSDVARDTRGDETHYSVRYVLTTYRVDLATLAIAPVPVRYFVRRHGLRPEEAVPVGTLTVPGATIARRSLLADDQQTYDIRDQRPAEARPRLFAWLPAVGLGLLLLSAAPVVLLLIGVGRRLYARRGMARPPSARQARAAARERLEAVRLTDARDETARRDAFAQLDTLVREHLAAVSHLPAASLTSRELATTMDSRHERVPLDRLQTILAACEQARYAPPDRLPTAEAFRDALADAEQVLATR